MGPRRRFSLYLQERAREEEEARKPPPPPPEPEPEPVRPDTSMFGDVDEEAFLMNVDVGHGRGVVSSYTGSQAGFSAPVQRPNSVAQESALVLPSQQRVLFSAFSQPPAAPIPADSYFTKQPTGPKEARRSSLDLSALVPKSDLMQLLDPDYDPNEEIPNRSSESQSTKHTNNNVSVFDETPESKIVTTSKKAAQPRDLLGGNELGFDDLPDWLNPELPVNNKQSSVPPPVPPQSTNSAASTSLHSKAQPSDFSDDLNLDFVFQRKSAVTPALAASKSDDLNLDFVVQPKAAVAPPIAAPSSKSAVNSAQKSELVNIPKKNPAAPVSPALVSPSQAAAIKAQMQNLYSSLAGALDEVISFFLNYIS